VEIRVALDDLVEGYADELQKIHEHSQALLEMYGLGKETIDTTSEDWVRWLKETKKFGSMMETS